MTATEIQTLAVYNAEKARGIVHNKWWEAEMKLLQLEFDIHIQTGGNGHSIKSL